MALDLSKLNEAQLAAAEHTEGPLLVVAGAGSGKCLGRDTDVIMYDGTVKKVQDVSVGDSLMGPDSKPRLVLSTTQGRGPMFRIEPIKGEPWTCNDVHVLTLHRTSRHFRGLVDVPLSEYISRCKPKPGFGLTQFYKEHKLVRCGVSFPKKRLRVEPYILGLWLGDGHVSGPTVSTADSEILLAIEEYASREGLSTHTGYDKRNGLAAIRLKAGDCGVKKGCRKGTPGRYATSWIFDEFKKCLVGGEKRIPSKYLRSSRKDRLELLAGLIDTDGSLSTGSFDFATKYEGLSDDVLFLARSLGLAAYSNLVRKTIKSLGFAGYYWRVSISGHIDSIPCRLERKRASARRQIKNVLHTGFTPVSIGDGDYYGFELNGDGRFLLGDFTITHNTATLTHRIANIVDKGLAEPYQILAITFTNKAANEMKERLAAMLPNGLDGMLVSTFHSMCVKFLRQDAERIGYARGFTIYDDGDSKRLMKKCMKDLGIDEKKLKPSSILYLISKAKNSMQDPTDFGGGRMADAEEAAAEYEKRKHRANCMDFDDLLTEAVRLLQDCPDVLSKYQNRFHYVVSDEFQDTNLPQSMLLKLLAGKHRNLMVVGDEDQCIFSFRGSSSSYIMDFEKEWPEAAVIKLERNYRSTGNILAVGNSVISNNSDRRDKRLYTTGPAGKPVACRFERNDRDESRFIADEAKRLAAAAGTYDGIAVLYRTNAQSRGIEDSFMRSGVPYRIVGGTKFFDRAEIRDIAAYLKFVVNPADDTSLSRIVNVPKRGIGEATVGRAWDWARSQDLTLWDALSAIEVVPGIGNKAQESIGGFVGGVTEMMHSAANHGVLRAVSSIVDGSGIVEAYEAEGSDESIGRAENVREFISVAAEYDAGHPNGTLDDFAEWLALRTDLDQEDEATEPHAVLMTIHASKGLEFPHVFIAGMEEGLLPHRNSLDDPAALEEERRLAYVAITRARESLYVIRTGSRMLFGQVSDSVPSRFIAEFPAEACDMSPGFAAGSRPPTQASGRPSGRAPYRPAGSSSPSPAPRVPATPRPPVVPAAVPVLVAGDRVRHATFGDGRVVSVRAGGDAVEIRFDRGGVVKKLMPAYAPLEKLP